MKHTTQAIAELVAPVAEREPVKNVEAWAKWFAFDLRFGSKDADQMKAMILAAAQFVKAIKAGAKPYWLTLLGSNGAGKTMVAKRICSWHRQSGLFPDRTEDLHGVQEIVYAREFCWWPGLARLLKGNDGYGQLHDVEAAAFSILDEIGAELDKSGHVTNCLSNALCARVGKWTIITSNKSLGQIETDVDPRVASRMIRDGSVVVDVDVTDYSLWKRKRG